MTRWPTSASSRSWRTSRPGSTRTCRPPRAVSARGRVRPRLRRRPADRLEEPVTMNSLNSITAAIIGGAILAIIVFVIAPGSAFNELSLTRWLHILAGVMWVGLLFYVFVVQIPALAAAAADKGGPGAAGISKYVAPRVLLWF